MKDAGLAVALTVAPGILPRVAHPLCPTYRCGDLRGTGPGRANARLPAAHRPGGAIRQWKM